MEHHTHNEKGNSGANTVLIVFVIILLVGLGLWWYLDQKGMERENDNGVTVDVNLPGDIQDERNAE